MRIYTIYGEEFGERVLGNLANPPKFCISCGLACIECRTSYGSFAADIFGVHKLPEQSQHFIDNPKDYFPKVVPTCDVVLAIGIHPDLLAELTWFVQRSKAKAVIAPIEDRSWCPPSLSRELQTKLTEMSVESAFPKPFCALDETGASVIDQFLKRYKIGKPLLELELKNDIITNTKVLRSAPCGSTWYVAEQIKWQNT